MCNHFAKFIRGAMTTDHKCKNILYNYMYTSLLGSTEHSENKNILEISRAMLNLECTCPAFNTHISCKNGKQLKQNLSTLSGLSFVSLALLQIACFLGWIGADSRSDLVFEQSKLHNNFIMGMLY